MAGKRNRYDMGLPIMRGQSGEANVEASFKRLRVNSPHFTSDSHSFAVDPAHSTLEWQQINEYSRVNSLLRSMHHDRVIRLQRRGGHNTNSGSRSPVFERSQGTVRDGLVQQVCRSNVYRSNNGLDADTSSDTDRSTSGAIRDTNTQAMPGGQALLWSTLSPEKAAASAVAAKLPGAFSFKNSSQEEISQLQQQQQQRSSSFSLPNQAIVAAQNQHFNSQQQNCMSLCTSQQGQKHNQAHYMESDDDDL